MGNFSLVAEGISKRYRIGTTKIETNTLRDAIVATVKYPLSRFRSLSGWADTESDTIWALKDVSFSVEHGEAIGIIGRNGAGKSTLLKILSRITRPTSGRAKVRGRVGSLLEVGTGFHPELTGRENIYLNAAVLGMRKMEVKEKFDEIVEFSGIEQFLDTPVKRYSSGMYVRLAFAVGAHLEPDILLVDEVLAVGDAEFQKRCMGKMGAVAEGGRTVLFVSHNLGAVNLLCGRSLLLEGGMIKAIGPSSEVVEAYLSSGTGSEASAVVESEPHKSVQYRGVRVLNQTGEVSSEISDTERFTVALDVEIRSSVPEIFFGMILQNAQGIRVLFADSRDVDNGFPSRLEVGTLTISVTIPPVLAAGRYWITCGIADVMTSARHDFRENVCSFSVTDTSSHRTHPRPGIVNLDLPWTISRP